MEASQQAARRLVAACRWWAIAIAAGLLITVTGVLNAINIGRAEAFAASDSPAPNLAAEAPQALRPAAENDDPSKAVIVGTVVDQAGKPVADAKVSAQLYEHPALAAVSAHDGHFRLKLDLPLANFKMVYAAGSDGRLLGRSQTEFMEFGRIVSCRIVLKPAVDMHVKVVDANGAAVLGAIVAVDDSEVYMAANGVSDSAGAALLHVPADAKVRVVVGFKSGVGFDYFENYTTSENSFGPVPTEVRLVFDGARTVRMRATDSAGRPLAGIPFSPALMSKKGKIAFVVNTSFLCRLKDRGVLPQSGKDGIAICDWFPPALKRAVPFDPIDSRYYCPASPYCDEATGGVVQPAEMLRLVKVSGRVTAADGSPAAGILVQAEGRGYTNNYCRAYARTAADGTYSMEVYPRQQYILAVIDPDRAAANVTGITMHQNQPRSGLDFRLGSGTVVEGRATSGSEAEPVADASLPVVAVGPVLPKSLAPGAEAHAELCRWADTDANGHYKIRLGPGKYQIATPDWKYHDFTVGTEPTITRDFHLLRAPRGPIDVIVHNADGSPAAWATLYSNAFEEGRTNSEGHFHSDRRQIAALLYAVDPSGSDAAVAAIGPDEKHAELTMRPAATAFGRSIGADGRPRANCFISTVIRMKGGGAGAQIAHHTAYASSDGTFRLTGLVDGTICDIYVCTSMRCSIDPVKKIEVHGAGLIDLGDLRIPPDEK